MVLIDTRFWWLVWSYFSMDHFVTFYLVKMILYTFTFFIGLSVCLSCCYLGG